MTETATAGKLSDLVAAYLVGDPDAIAIIDVAVGVAHTVSWVRESPHVEEYAEVRQECDEAIDSLVDPFRCAERNGWLSEL